MGILAENKKSRRRMTISRDPNNSRWMRDTSTFGQKILRAQGWEAGQLLGAQNTATAKLHSQASAACIRVSLKDDVKGLGYNRAAEDKVTGLDVFSDVLSRLNGKSEEDVKKKKQERLAFQSNFYMQQKWGVMRFVSGGLLVGDVPKEETVREEETEESAVAEKVKKGKKRKLVEDSDSKEEKKKRRKEEKRRTKKATQERQEDCKDDEMRRAMGEGCGKSEDKMEEKAKKKSKKLKDKGRRLDDDGESKKERKKGRRKAEAETEAETEPATGTESEAKAVEAETTSMAASRGNRNFARSRFIAAKRQAMMDTQALNQILMIKT
ncbi:hypothetical protein CP533_4100 [Ophiocordyceps camponoti-saundersi (nom. inval.)]|nr:hypothetical protein CP533_4100 [Ophiocordyceps camponoti-saundersi (nom. inval.)]